MTTSRKIRLGALVLSLAGIFAALWLLKPGQVAFVEHRLRADGRGESVFRVSNPSNLPICFTAVRPGQPILEVQLFNAGGIERHFAGESVCTGIYLHELKARESVEFVVPTWDCEVPFKLGIHFIRSTAAAELQRRLRPDPLPVWREAVYLFKKFTGGDEPTWSALVPKPPWEGISKTQPSNPLPPTFTESDLSD